MSKLAFFVSFKYLCNKSTAIIFFLILSESDVFRLIYEKKDILQNKFIYLMRSTTFNLTCSCH